MIAQRSLLSNPSLRDKFSISLCNIISGEDNLKLTNCLNKTAALAAALLRLLGGGVCIHFASGYCTSGSLSFLF